MRKGEINGLLLRLKVRNFLGRGLKGMVYTFLKLVAYGYRSINPYKKQSRNLIRDVKLVENEDRDELHKLLKSQTPFEHIIVGASSTYKDRRIEIAKQAYAK
jgi:hypothetical protein